jgi:transposase
LPRARLISAAAPMVWRGRCNRSCSRTRSAKRLEGGTFKWPPISDGVMRLSGAQLAALFDGLDWRRMYAPKVPRPKVAG